MDLALNNPQWLICHKTKQKKSAKKETKTNSVNVLAVFLGFFGVFFVGFFFLLNGAYVTFCKKELGR